MDQSQIYDEYRVKAMQDEREQIQKKVFTKWINSIIQEQQVNDLYIDLSDGYVLHKLVEILFNEKLPRLHKSKMRIHKLENVDKVLFFLCSKRIYLESIGAQDIVDGNPRLILGIIWTLVLISGTIETSEENSLKDTLLIWAQKATSGYAGVSITNFTTSWKDGLAFNALIHFHYPALFDYNSLQENKPIDNINHAFDLANKLGIPKLLDTEDIINVVPDEKNIITYVMLYFKAFNKNEKNNTDLSNGHMNLNSSSCQSEEKHKECMNCKSLENKESASHTKEIETNEKADNTVLKINNSQVNRKSFIEQMNLNSSNSQSKKKHKEIMERKSLENEKLASQTKEIKTNENANITVVKNDNTLEVKRKSFLEKINLNRSNSQSKEKHKEKMENKSLEIKKPASQTKDIATNNKDDITVVNNDNSQVKQINGNEQRETKIKEFYSDAETIDGYIKTLKNIANSQKMLSATNLKLFDSLENKHILFTHQIKIVKSKMENLEKLGNELISYKYVEPSEIEQLIKNYKQEWDEVNKLAMIRTGHLENAFKSHEFYNEAKQMCLWLKEKVKILHLADVDLNKKSLQILYQKHLDLQKELTNYSDKVCGLNILGEELIKTGVSTLDFISDECDTIYDTKIIPIVYWENEPVEKVEYKEVFEEYTVLQIEAVKNFDDGLLKIDKQEMCTLLNKCDDNWWYIRNAKGVEGVAPATYFSEIMPKLTKIPIKQAEKVKAIQKVKNVKMVPVEFPMSDWYIVSKMQIKVNDTYKKLQENTAAQLVLLEKFKCIFSRSYNDMEIGIDKSKLLRIGKTIDEAKKELIKINRVIIINCYENQSLSDELAKQDVTANFYTLIHQINKYISEDQSLIDVAKNDQGANSEIKEEITLENNNKRNEQFQQAYGKLEKWILEKLVNSELEDFEEMEEKMRSYKQEFERVNKLGQLIILTDNSKEDDINKNLKNLDKKWKELTNTILEYNQRLRQNIAEITYNNKVETINEKLIQIEKTLKNAKMGIEVRRYNNLFKKIGTHEIHSKTSVVKLIEGNNEVLRKRKILQKYVETVLQD